MKMYTKYPFSTNELCIIWRYFDGISTAISERLVDGRPPSEPDLTFLLMELLDEGWTARHVLEYPLAKAVVDLATVGFGTTLKVSFQTHKHTGPFESAISGADFGIVFNVDHPSTGHSRHAVLLQAKRLYPDKANKYSLGSIFKEFDKSQFDHLQMIHYKVSDYQNQIFYLWYCPPSSTFNTDHKNILQQMEAARANPTWGMGDWHPRSEWVNEIEHWTQIVARGMDNEREALDRDWRSRQPALRLTEVDKLTEIIKKGSKPSLQDLVYMRFRGSRHNWDFSPFAELFTRGLIDEHFGSSKEAFIRLACGQAVKWDELGQVRDEKALLSNTKILEDKGPTPPAHTITFSLSTSLSFPEGFKKAQ